LNGYDPCAGNELSRAVSNRSVQAGAINLRQASYRGKEQGNHAENLSYSAMTHAHIPRKSRFPQTRRQNATLVG
jgi:hypothetical protein